MDRCPEVVGGQQQHDDPGHPHPHFAGLVEPEQIGEGLGDQQQPEADGSQVDGPGHDGQADVPAARFRHVQPLSLAAPMIRTEQPAGAAEWDTQ